MRMCLNWKIFCIVKQIEHFNLRQLACKKANCLFYSFSPKTDDIHNAHYAESRQCFYATITKNFSWFKKTDFFKTHHSVPRFLLQIQYQSSLPRKYLPLIYVNIRNLHDNCRRIQLYQL